MRFLGKLFWVTCLLGVLGSVAIFVISNQDAADISIWPSLSISAPIWASILASFGFGLFIGASFVWIAHLPKRARLHIAQRKVQKLQTEIKIQKQDAQNTARLEALE